MLSQALLEYAGDGKAVEEAAALLLRLSTLSDDELRDLLPAAPEAE